MPTMTNAQRIADAIAQGIAGPVLREVTNAMARALGDAPLAKAAGGAATEMADAELSAWLASRDLPDTLPEAELAALAKAALAQDEPTGGVAGWLAGRGVTLEDDPADALPAELRKVLDVRNPDREVLAKAARDERLTSATTQRTTALAARLQADAVRFEAAARARGDTHEAALAKAAGEVAPSILDVARSIPRTVATIPPPDPNGPDRREEIRALAAQQRAFCNFDGAALTERELIHQEALANARTHRRFITVGHAPAAA
jgi:hypothetical protein